MSFRVDVDHTKVLFPDRELLTSDLRSLLKNQLLLLVKLTHEDLLGRHSRCFFPLRLDAFRQLEALLELHSQVFALIRRGVIQHFDDFHSILSCDGVGALGRTQNSLVLHGRFELRIAHLLVLFKGPHILKATEVESIENVRPHFSKLHRRRQLSSEIFVHLSAPLAVGDCFFDDLLNRLLFLFLRLVLDVEHSLMYHALILSQGDFPSLSSLQTLRLVELFLKTVHEW